MATLTQKQDNFCAAYIETGNGSESYRRAYNAARMKPETIANEASKLLQNPDITMRIGQLRGDAQQRHKLTVDDLINELEEARIIASTGERPQATAMVAATMGKAKLLGFDSPKPETPIAQTYSFTVLRAGTELKND